MSQPLKVKLRVKGSLRLELKYYPFFPMVCRLLCISEVDSENSQEGFWVHCKLLFENRTLHSTMCRSLLTSNTNISLCITLLEVMKNEFSTSAENEDWVYLETMGTWKHQHCRRLSPANRWNITSKISWKTENSPAWRFSFLSTIKIFCKWQKIQKQHKKNWSLSSFLHDEEKKIRFLFTTHVSMFRNLVNLSLQMNGWTEG